MNANLTEVNGVDPQELAEYNKEQAKRKQQEERKKQWEDNVNKPVTPTEEKK